MQVEEMMRWPRAIKHTNRSSAGRARSDDAVSSVVGTVLMVAVTVVIFGGLAIAVFDQVSEAPDSQTATLTVAGRDDQSLVVTHQGGEPLPLAELEMDLVVDGTQVTVATADLAVQLDDGENWIIGETICIVGASSLCLHPPGTDVSQVQVRFNNHLLVNSGPVGGT